jgi:hypothetical protein
MCTDKYTVRKKVLNSDKSHPPGAGALRAECTEHGASGGPTYPSRITENGAENPRNYSGNQVK